jgi:hypothetical protein
MTCPSRKRWNVNNHDSSRNPLDYRKKVKRPATQLRAPTILLTAQYAPSHRLDHPVVRVASGAAKFPPPAKGRRARRPARPDGQSRRAR